MFKKIMWATDGSDNAENALGYAVQIAREESAELHVAHVVEKYVGTRIAGLTARPDEPELDAKIKAQADHLAAENDIKTVLHMVSGRAAHVASALEETARQAGVDLIVVGTRGHSAAAGLILGSVTQQLLHVASCPVLAVPPAGRHQRRGSQPESIAATP